MPRIRSTLSHLALALAALLATAVRGQAQDQRDEWFYYPGSYNWQFLKTYPSAARLFNAFDYGHAVLYERLYTDGPRAGEALERDFRFLTTDLLVRPPKFGVPEEVVAPAYAKAAWRAMQMFDWAHTLHRQIYDVYADERLPMSTKDSLIERLTDFYLRRREYAFAPVPKAMDLMEGQPFSRGFRQAHPQFNGLIWAYHWLQVGLYEPLAIGRTAAERKAGVEAAVAHFWTMLRKPPSSMPRAMPMTVAIAPTFSARHPRAAAIFDNLHMLHDIISDILTSGAISHRAKRDAIYAQLNIIRDTTTHLMSWEDWRAMPAMMGGAAAMGGAVPGAGLPDTAPSSSDMPHHQHGHH